MELFDIVTVGHLSIDFITSPARTSAKPTLGGPPTYVSLAAKKLNADVSIISKVGNDLPPEYLRWLEKQGVNISMVKQVTNASTTSYALRYGENGKRRLVLKNRGPLIKGEDIPCSFKTKAAHIAPIANEIVYEAVLKLRRQAELVSLDPQGFIRFFKQDGTVHLGKMRDPEVLQHVDVVKASEDEMKAMTGEPDLEKAVRKICQQGVKTVIVTRGRKGAVLRVNGRTYHIPVSKPNVVVDTTGAGDAFIGGFLAEHVRGKDAVWSACVGSASASFVVEEPGPSGFGLKKDVYERAEQVYADVHVVRRL